MRERGALDSDGRTACLRVRQAKALVSARCTRNAHKTPLPQRGGREAAVGVG